MKNKNCTLFIMALSIISVVFMNKITVSASVPDSDPTEYYETETIPEDGETIQEGEGAADEEAAVEEAAVEEAAAEEAVDIEAAAEEAVDIEADENVTTHVKTQNGLTFKVSYPTEIKCGENTDFIFETTGGSGNYKYRLHSLVQYDGQEYVSVYDTSYGTNGSYQNIGSYAFKFMVSGTYYIRFNVMDMSTNKTADTGTLQYGIVLNVADEDYPSVEEIVDKTAAECLNSGAKTDYEKALWLNDWIVDHSKYDNSYSYCSAEGALARGLGTCEAYHRAYVMLLNKVGVRTGRIVANNHVWTAVNMDGKWYHVDTTWNDCGYDGDTDTLYHLYFGLNDDTMALVQDGHKPNEGYECNSLDNNYFVKNGKTKVLADTLVNEVQNHLDNGDTEFSINITNTYYSNILYSLAAYDLSKRDWIVNGQYVELKSWFEKASKYDSLNGTLFFETRINEYTVTYVLNGGVNNPENPAKYIKRNSAISLAAPTKKGYTFAGWYKESAFTNKVTSIPAKSSGNKKYYAKWNVNKYSIVFKGNGSTSGSVAAMTGLKYGSSYTLKTNAFKRKGYKFAGWNTKADGKGTSYSNKAVIKSLTTKNGGTVTLYARWTKVKYTITYNLNKGKNNSSNPKTYYVTTTTIKLKNPSRSGYTFKGWYSDSKYKNRVTEIKKGSTGNKTLYAKWVKK